MYMCMCMYTVTLHVVYVYMEVVTGVDKSLLLKKELIL